MDKHGSRAGVPAPADNIPATGVPVALIPARAADIAAVLWHAYLPFLHFAEEHDAANLPRQHHDPRPGGAIAPAALRVAGLSREWSLRRTRQDQAEMAW